MSRKREKWEAKVLDGEITTVKISENPIDPAIHDLSGKEAHVSVVFVKSKSLGIIPNNDEDGYWVDLHDTEPVD